MASERSDAVQQFRGILRKVWLPPARETGFLAAISKNQQTEPSPSRQMLTTQFFSVLLAPRVSKCVLPGRLLWQNPPQLGSCGEWAGVCAAVLSGEWCTVTSSHCFHLMAFSLNLQATSFRSPADEIDPTHSSYQTAIDCSDCRARASACLSAAPHHAMPWVATLYIIVREETCPKRSFKLSAMEVASQQLVPARHYFVLLATRTVAKEPNSIGDLGETTADLRAHEATRPWSVTATDSNCARTPVKKAGQ